VIRARTLATGIVLGAIVGVVCGAASALFLVLLEHATHTRQAHSALVYTLPVAGLVIGALYERLGKSIKGGNNLVIDTLHDGGPEIPLRMAPMVLLGTVLTHLFGGSAGREGTAVQMGASLADAVSHRLRRRRLLATALCWRRASRAASARCSARPSPVRSSRWRWWCWAAARVRRRCCRRSPPRSWATS
jgi:H+/Cl- antiporter ClcA